MMQALLDRRGVLQAQGRAPKKSDVRWCAVGAGIVLLFLSLPAEIHRPAPHLARLLAEPSQPRSRRGSVGFEVD